MQVIIDGELDKVRLLKIWDELTLLDVKNGCLLYLMLLLMYWLPSGSAK